MKLSKYNVVKICVLGFVITFCLLYYFEKNYEQITPIEEITMKDINTKIRTVGIISNQKLHKNMLFFDIENNNQKIKAVAFDISDKINSSNDYLITGTLTLYKQELEIIVSSIEKIK